MKIMKMNNSKKSIKMGKKSKVKKLKQRVKIMHNKLELMYKIGGLIVGLIIVPLCILLVWKLSTNPHLYYY